MRKYIVLLFVITLFVQCKKEELFNNTPEITLNNYGPSQILEFKDSVYFSIAYADGNGDLGENAPDAFNLIVTDNRIGTQYKFRIQELVPNNAEVPIKGNLTFSIPTVFITDYSQEQNVSYNIYVKDRAGNKSNVVTTGFIKVIK